MKKRVLICIIISILLMGGCQVSSDHFLSFQENFKLGYYDNHTDANDFFANDLAIISEDEQLGGDPLLNAGATLLINTTENEVIYADQVFEKLYPASLTKLVTALVVLEQAELTDLVTVSYNASHIRESAAKICGFKEGDIVSLDSLLHCLLIYSGNDVGIAIAEHVGGSEKAFAEKMNEVAKQLGAVHSNFVNPHGLHDDNQYTTAYDMYLILHELIKYDKFLSIINMSTYTVSYVDVSGNEKHKKFNSTNWYLNGNASIDDIMIVGGKTGTTSKAGNCLILFSQDNNSMEYISIILKAPSNNVLYTQMNHLLSYSKD